MLYSFFLSKKGYTFVEVLIVVVVLSILVAVGVPIFTSGLKAQRIKDCNNNRTVITAAFREAMTGMEDNGKAQEKVDFNNIQSDHKTRYPGDGVTGTADDEHVNKECFVLIEDQGIPGKIAFTLGDLRGGYFGQNEWNSKYNEYPDGFGRLYGPWVDGETQLDPDKYDIGCQYGYYLKKEAMGNIKFYQLAFTNQEIPECPFADFDNNDASDDYYYYILEDGTVLCNCPHCNEN